MRLRYTRPALADLDSILTYIAEKSPRGAMRVHQRVKSVAELLLEYPRIGILTQEPHIRRVTTRPYPYLIFYEVSDDEIIVHAVRHASRNPSTMPGIS